MLRHVIYYSLSFVLLTLVPGCHQKQQTYPYLIKIDGCTDCSVTLSGFPPSYNTLDTAQRQAGQLVLSGTVTQPGVYRIFGHKPTDKNFGIGATIYLPADSVQLTVLPKEQENRTFYHIYQQLGLGSYLRNAVIFSTSPQQKELERYLYLNDSLWNKFLVDKSLVTAKLVQTYDSGNRALVEQWSDSARLFEGRFPKYMAQSSVLFAKQYPHSDLTAYALLDNAKLPNTQPVLRPYYRALPDSLKQSYYGKLLAKEFGEVQE